MPRRAGRFAAIVSKLPVPNGATFCADEWCLCRTGGGAIGCCIGVGMRACTGGGADDTFAGGRFRPERRSPARPVGGPGGGSVGTGPVTRFGVVTAGGTPTSVGRRAPGGGGRGRA